MQAQDRSQWAVLIDDAQELGSAELQWLQDVVSQARQDVAVAYRPWPQPEGLADLVSVLAQHQTPLMLGPLDAQHVAQRVARLSHPPLSDQCMGHLLVQTGGMSWMIQSALSAVADMPAVPSPATATEVAIAAIRQDVGTISEDLRSYLLDLAIGFDPSGEVHAARVTTLRQVDELVAQGMAEGLILPDGSIPPMLAEVLRSSTPVHQVRATQRDLVRARMQAGRSLESVARGLARSGFEDTHVAAALEKAADKALGTQPDLAAELFDEALLAGGDEIRTAARRAQAAAVNGDLDGADKILEGLFSVPNAPDLNRAVDVCAAVWAQRGVWARSADIYRWLGPERTGVSAPLAAVTLYAVGDAPGAEAMLDAQGPGSPTLVGGAVSLMGQGVRQSIEGCPTAAIASLVRASDMMSGAGTREILPDQPAALAALVALHDGYLDLADRVLSDALECEQGGPQARPRLLLLQAWAAMMRDQLELAHRLCAALPRGSDLAPRDFLVLCALEVALARRADDHRGMVDAWRRAREQLMHTPVDLYTLMPLGELFVAAARLRDSERIRAHMSTALELLDTLEQPALWSVPLHWAGVQAAILAERPADLRPHAVALVRAAEHSERAAVLARAGKAWLAVLSGHFDSRSVEQSARELAQAGFRWDGARLAGHAAGHADDRADMTRLLACARELQGQRKEVVAPAAARLSNEAKPAFSQDDLGAGRGATDLKKQIKETIRGVLSEREQEVARLVVQGKTYKEIGDALYVSPRTVEHHVARMRRRLGAKNRSVLLDILREELASITTSDRPHA